MNHVQISVYKLTGSISSSLSLSLLSVHRQPTPAQPTLKDVRLSACETRPRGRHHTRRLRNRRNSLSQSFCSARMEEYVPPRTRRVDQRCQGPNTDHRLSMFTDTPCLVFQHITSRPFFGSYLQYYLHCDPPPQHEWLILRRFVDIADVRRKHSSHPELDWVYVHMDLNPVVGSRHGHPPDNNSPQT